MLEVLQDQFSTGLFPSTLKVYMVALPTYHAPLGGVFGKNPFAVSSVVHQIRRDGGFRLIIGEPHKRCVMRRAGPVHFHSAGLPSFGLHPGVPGAAVLVFLA